MRKYRKPLKSNRPLPKEGRAANPAGGHSSFADPSVFEVESIERKVISQLEDYLGKDKL